MHAVVRAELDAVEPFDALEREHLADALAWVASGAELCRRAKPATPPKHLVAYFAVVDGAHILLVDHRNAQMWLAGGGHVEPSEHPRTTVVRELREEFGLAPDHPVGPAAMVTCATTVGLTAGHTDVSLWYVIAARRDAVLHFDQTEFSAGGWFPFDALPQERLDPNVRRFVAKLQARPDLRARTSPT